MDRSAVQDWLDAYVRAWQTYDREDISALFGVNASYSFGPFGEPVVGRDRIVESWMEDRDAPGTWEAHYEPVAVDGDLAVTNGRSTYFEDDTRTTVARRYDNVYVIRFDGDGRCIEFREWYMRDPATGAD
jgi:hypothetical protein